MGCRNAVASVNTAEPRQKQFNRDDERAIKKRLFPGSSLRRKSNICDARICLAREHQQTLPLSAPDDRLRDDNVLRSAKPRRTLCAMFFFYFEWNARIDSADGLGQNPK